MKVKPVTGGRESGEGGEGEVQLFVDDVEKQRYAAKARVALTTGKFY
jgi:hypothetical protein